VAAVALNPLCIVSEACINYIFCGTLEISNEARNWFAGNNEDVWATHLLEQWIGKFSVMVIGGWETFPTTWYPLGGNVFSHFPATHLDQFPGGQWFGPLFTHCRRTCRNARRASQLPKYLHLQPCIWYLRLQLDCSLAYLGQPLNKLPGRAGNASVCLMFQLHISDGLIGPRGRRCCVWVWVPGNARDVLGHPSILGAVLTAVKSC